MEQFFIAGFSVELDNVKEGQEMIKAKTKIKYWSLVSLCLTLMFSVHGLKAQEGGFPKWRLEIDLGSQSTRFYGSDAGRDFIMEAFLPTVGIGLGYMPSVRWSYDGRLSWQEKRSRSTRGIDYILEYAVMELSLNYGLFWRPLKPFYWKWIYGNRERPMRLWTYGGLGYYVGYLLHHRQGLWYIDDPGLKKIDHGLLIRFWNVFFYDDYRGGGYVNIGLLLNIYVGMQRVLDFKTFAMSSLFLAWYPAQFRVSYIW